MTELTNLTVAGIRDGHRAGDFSAVEVAEAFNANVAGAKALTAFIVGRIMKIQFVNLSNIMLGREIIPELLQERCVCGNICQYVLELLKHGDLYERQMEGFDKVKEILSQGRQTPSENASDVVLELKNFKPHSLESKKEHL